MKGQALAILTLAAMGAAPALAQAATAPAAAAAPTPDWTFTANLGLGVGAISIYYHPGSGANGQPKIDNTELYIATGSTKNISDATAVVSVAKTF